MRSRPTTRRTTRTTSRPIRARRAARAARSAGRAERQRAEARASHRSRPSTSATTPASRPPSAARGEPRPARRARRPPRRTASARRTRVQGYLGAGRTSTAMTTTASRSPRRTTSAASAATTGRCRTSEAVRRRRGCRPLVGTARGRRPTRRTTRATPTPDRCRISIRAAGGGNPRPPHTLASQFIMTCIRQLAPLPSPSHSRNAGLGCPRPNTPDSRLVAVGQADTVSLVHSRVSFVHPDR
mmetsp:Transcript_28122/g.87138  ORF Transcript_28122/g.87138 Transcript_28122/m.87138 type:complete len:242 (+) Transcript_28122:598-1323(+)